DADPDGPWAARVAETAHPLDAQGKRRKLLAAFADGSTNVQHLAVVDLAQEKQRDVQVFRFDPLDVRGRARQGLLQDDGTVADALAQLDGDEGAQTGHDWFSRKRGGGALL